MAVRAFLLPIGAPVAGADVVVGPRESPRSTASPAPPGGAPDSSDSGPTTPALITGGVVVTLVAGVSVLGLRRIASGRRSAAGGPGPEAQDPAAHAPDRARDAGAGG